MEPNSPDFPQSEEPLAPEAELKPANPAQAAAPPPKSSGFGLLLRDLVVAVAASVLIITFLYQPVVVEGISMLPRLEDQDRLFVNKFVYHFTSIERGDVVVFRYPRDLNASYIKRVIALPGDRLRIVQGTVWVNGVALKENYVPEEFRDSDSYPEFVVPDNYFFMMGDHRSISYDSRKFGPVERSLIYGKAVFVYWPARDAGVVR